MGTVPPAGDLRVGVVGAGRMGASHVERIGRRIRGAIVSAIVEPDPARAETALAAAPGARAFAGIEDAIGADGIDAVLIATPGSFHEPVLIPALAADLPILCEKPLAPDAEAARRIVELELQLDRPHIQVGFMRRFDAEYLGLRGLIESRELGELLLLHCAHRNPSVLAGYTEEMLITDSVVHELDVVPWLAGSPVRAVEVRHGRANSLSPAGLREPIVVLLDLGSGVLADVEMSVSVQFGYEVTTEAVFERGVARIGQVGQHASFTTRFAEAYDLQIQRWVDAVRQGALVDGPTAWDGYQVALACEAGVASLSGGVVAVEAIERPAFYG